jgi:hypothetical protein
MKSNITKLVVLNASLLCHTCRVHIQYLKQNRRSSVRNINAFKHTSLSCSALRSIFFRGVDLLYLVLWIFLLPEASSAQHIWPSSGRSELGKAGRLHRKSNIKKVFRLLSLILGGQVQVEIRTGLSHWDSNVHLL